MIPKMSSICPNPISNTLNRSRREWVKYTCQELCWDNYFEIYQYLSCIGYAGKQKGATHHSSKLSLCAIIKEMMKPLMKNSEDWSRPLVTCTGNPCQSTGTSSPVSTGNLPVLPVKVTNCPDRSFGFLITHSPRGRGVNAPIHFYYVLHAKRGEGVQIACKIAYILNGRPQTL